MPALPDNFSKKSKGKSLKKGIPLQHQKSDVIELLESEPSTINNSSQLTKHNVKGKNKYRSENEPRMSSFTQGFTLHQKEKEMTITLVAISLIFVICQSIKLVPDIYELAVCDHFKLHKNGYDPTCQNTFTIDVFIRLGKLFSCINSAVNFLIYIVVSKKFRNAFKETFISCRQPSLYKPSIENETTLMTEK